MAEIVIHYDRGTATLVVWFGDPAGVADCEHTDSDVIIMLDGAGKPLGIEVLEFEPGEGPLRLSIDQVDTSASLAPAPA
ncbi:MAG: hypothetical protein AMXMBFR80_07320 [Dehalococcoidia bacterium]